MSLQIPNEAFEETMVSTMEDFRTNRELLLTMQGWLNDYLETIIMSGQDDEDSLALRVILQAIMMQEAELYMKVGFLFLALSDGTFPLDYSAQPIAIEDGKSKYDVICFLMNLISSYQTESDLIDYEDDVIPI